MKFEDIQVGMKLIFDPRVLENGFMYSMGGFNVGYVDSFMDKLAGQKVTITSKSNSGVYVHIKEDSGRYSYDGRYFLTEEECKELSLKTQSKLLEEDNERTYTDFKIGDLVKFRDLDILKKYYLIARDKILMSYCMTLEIYEDYKKYNAVIIQRQKKYNEYDIEANCVQIKFESKDNKCFWVDEALIEIVEENYMEKKKVRAKEEIEKMCKKLETTDEVVEEMISKVDVTKFKKILASATAKRGSSFKGIDKVIRSWANAKKDLYLLFGRNLKLTKEIEYEANIDDFKTDFFELFKQFPRTSIII